MYFSFLSNFARIRAGPKSGTDTPLAKNFLTTNGHQLTRIDPSSLDRSLRRTIPLLLEEIYFETACVDSYVRN
jgi:hypothetical protein